MPKGLPGTSALHSTHVSRAFAQGVAAGSLPQAFIARVAQLADEKTRDGRVRQGDGTNTVAQQGGNGMGYAGYTPQQGEHSIAITDHPGDVVAPLPGAPVHETAMGLLPKGLQALQPVANEGGLDLNGADRNREGGVDATRQRTCMVTAGLRPHSTEHPRQHQTTTRGRTRWCKAAIQA
jgi:hypothetical protein